MGISKDDAHTGIIARAFNFTGAATVLYEICRLHPAGGKMLLILPPLAVYLAEAVLLIAPPPGKIAVTREWMAYFYASAAMILPLLGFVAAPGSGPRQLAALGADIGLVANFVQLYSLTYLGRSFSVLPESRTLVTRGPYAYVRHPVYAAYMLWGLGSFLISPGWKYGIFLVGAYSLQFLRARAEEKLLLESQPGYADYFRRVPMLIPDLGKLLQEFAEYLLKY